MKINTNEHHLHTSSISCFMYNLLFPTDPFKCGVVYPKVTRTTLIYVPDIPDNTTQSTNATTQLNTTTETVNSIPNATISPTSYTDLDVDEDFNYMPESVVATRIVNGEHCPPGECPWQVEFKMYHGRKHT